MEVTSEAKAVVERYHFLQSQLNRAEQAKCDAQRAIVDADKSIEFLTPWIASLKGSVCPDCNGHGYYRQWIAQDEVRAVKCPSCNKTGVKSEPATVDSAAE